jgi:glutamyl/glutaminyl-tRNA synthetase
MLFNQRAAHQSGGRFLVRFEDNSIDTLWTKSPHSLRLDEMSRYCDRQREAIQWLGIPVDGFEKQSQMDLKFKEFVAHHGWFIPEYKWPYSIPLDPVWGDYNPEEGEWFPHSDYLTYHRVVYDELDGVNLLIRGDDLRSEFSLYQHYRAWLGLPEITHYYLPRLYGQNGEIVSKFHLARSILDYKNVGWTAEKIIKLLAQSVLVEPGDGWQLSNVKRHPRLSTEFNIKV